MGTCSDGIGTFEGPGNWRLGGACLKFSDIYSRAISVSLNQGLIVAIDLVVFEIDPLLAKAKPQLLRAKDAPQCCLAS